MSLFQKLYSICRTFYTIGIILCTPPISHLSIVYSHSYVYKAEIARMYYLYYSLMQNVSITAYNILYARYLYSHQCCNHIIFFKVSLVFIGDSATCIML